MTADRDDLTDEERRALIDLLGWEIQASRFPLADRVRLLKRIRAKLLRAASKARREGASKPRRRDHEPSA
jgi:hypothetical protein